jgi:hypothetical protein
MIVIHYFEDSLESKDATGSSCGKALSEFNNEFVITVLNSCVINTILIGIVTFIMLSGGSSCWESLEDIAVHLCV